MPIILFIVLLGCIKPKEAISDKSFDKKYWKNDPLGCKGHRETMTNDFNAIKSKLIGASEKVIQKTLGKPDQLELYKRQQKFYTYFVEAGSQCDSTRHKKPGRYIYIRFNAFRKVSEVGIMR